MVWVSQMEVTEMDFYEWIRQVDKLLSDKYGLESMDFEDWHWSDAWQDDYTPKSAVRAAERYWND